MVTVLNFTPGWVADIVPAHQQIPALNVSARYAMF
jgi:hypothetical protein